MLWLFTLRMDALPYLPSPWLPSAWTVSPAPLQAARLESLLGNKPKAPAASTRDPTGFITRSLTHFCCLNAGAWAQFNFRAKTALPSYGDAPYQKTTQEPPALSPWAFQHTWEHHPQDPNCITVQSTHHSHTNWVMCKPLSTAKTLSCKSHDKINQVCYEFSNRITDAMCKFLSKTKIPCTVNALILSSNFSKTLYLNQKM